MLDQVAQGLALSRAVLEVTDTCELADGIRSYELVNREGALPPFTAGSHIDLHLPNGITRSYSLVNSDLEWHRYMIAVALDRNSRGGSHYIHESLATGQTVEVSGPRNEFELFDADHSIFFAGGIGITPVMPMLARLEREGRSWQLHYCGRSRSAVAFSDHLQRYGDRVRFHFDDECDGRLLDIAEIMQAETRDTHFYCCGPAGMLETFRKTGERFDPHRIHFEYFASSKAAATQNTFEVVLAQSDKTITVREGQTILDAVNDAGIAIDYSCAQGICGTCETRVLEGLPDHRDEVLTESERQSNQTMMICCSGSLSPRLVLDI